MKISYTGMINRLNAEKDTVGEFSCDFEKDLNNLIQEEPTARLDNANLPIFEKTDNTEFELIAQSAPQEITEDSAFGLSNITLNSSMYAPGDLGNAQRFYDAYGNIFKYVSDQQNWYIYDGKKWKLCTGREEEQHFLRVVKEMKFEAQHAADIAKTTDEKSKERQFARLILKNYERSCNADSTRAALIQATRDSEFRLYNEALDKEAYLFNAANGTINLKDGSLRDFSRKDYITQISSSSVDNSKNCVVWKKFLNDVFLNDQHLIDYVQKIIGSVMIGKSTEEQQFYMLNGDGANGKSTFINVLTDIFGDYAAVTMPELWQEQSVDKSADGATPGAVILRGKRLIIAAELEKRKKFNESFIKQVTGGDTITARYMRKEFFNFKPVCTLFLTANNKPNISTDNYALWRRLMLIPFKATFTESQKDKTLPDQLKNEYDGILNWVLEGCLKYQQEGLKDVPAAIHGALDEYKNEMDKVKEFLVDGYETTESDKDCVKLSDLYEHYTKFCQQSKYYAMNLQNFKKDLEKKGFVIVRRNSGNVVLKLLKFDLV